MMLSTAVQRSSDCSAPEGSHRGRAATLWNVLSPCSSPLVGFVAVFDLHAPLPMSRARLAWHHVISTRLSTIGFGPDRCNAFALLFAWVTIYTEGLSLTRRYLSERDDLMAFGWSAIELLIVFVVGFLLFCVPIITWDTARYERLKKEAERRNEGTKGP